MSAEEKYQAYEAKLTVVDLPYVIKEEDGAALGYSLTNEKKKPQLNNLMSLNTLGKGPATKSISLPNILCPIKEDKLDFNAALGLPLAPEDGKHDCRNLMCMGELGMKVDSSATELVSCPGVVCLIKEELKVNVEKLDNFPRPDELRQGEHFDSPASESDSRSDILFLGSELRNALSQDQDTNRRQFDFSIKESRPRRSSPLGWDQEKSPLSPDHEEGRFKTLSGTDGPRKSYAYESHTRVSLDCPNTLCLESQIQDFSSLDTPRKKNDFPATDPTARQSVQNLASQPHDFLVEESQEGQLRFPKREMDIPDSESQALSSERYLATDLSTVPGSPPALHDEEHDLTNSPCPEEPRSYGFPPRGVVFFAKSRTLPNNSSFMDMSHFDTDPQPKLSKWASFKNKLIGPPFRGSRVMNTRIAEQLNGHEVGSSREKDSPPTTTLLGALDLEVPRNKKLMPWTRIKQAMRVKRNSVEDQNYQDGGQGKGSKGKGHRREKSPRMFGLGWMQKAFSTTVVVREEVQEAKPNYPVDTYNTILDREM